MFNNVDITKLTPSVMERIPQLQDYLLSEDVLGNPDAQNSAQRAESEAGRMTKAYNAIMDFSKSVSPPPTAEQAAQANKAYETRQAEAYNTGEKKYQPNSRVFAGGYFETDNQGRLKDETYEIARKMNSGELLGFAPMGGGRSNSRGRQSVQYPQTNTSNVAKFGEAPRQATEFETHLARIRGTQPGVETFGNSQDRARWEADAYRAKAMSEAEAQKNKK